MIILQDTREKLPWNFIGYEKCLAQKTECLTEGDYTLFEYPNLICIERKRNVVELANNLGRKFTQFKTELEKLQKYRFRYVLCEFSEQEMLIYPKGIKLPARIIKKIRMGGKFLHHRINELINTYQIEFIFCDNRFLAQDMAMKLFLEAQRIYDTENQR